VFLTNKSHTIIQLLCKKSRSLTGSASGLTLRIINRVYEPQII